MTKKVVDVAIIGAGPVGMYTGFYCGLRKLNTLLFDSLAIMGGQASSLYAEKYIEDLPGHPKIRAKTFIDQLSKQLQSVSDFVVPTLATTITTIEKQEDNTFAIRAKNATWYAKAVVLTVGNGAFTPRTLGLANENNFKNIHYFIKNLQAFQNRHIVLFGGGDSAVDWSLMLEPIAASISLVHRRNEFRAKEANVAKLKKANVQLYTPYTIKTIAQQANDIVQQIHIEDVNTKDIVALPVDDIIVNYGVIANLGFIKDWQELAIKKNKILATPTGETSIPGIFACGDVVDYPGREAQMVTGFAEGLMTSAAIARYINPNTKVRPIR